MERWAESVARRAPAGGGRSRVLRRGVMIAAAVAKARGSPRQAGSTTQCVFGSNKRGHHAVILPPKTEHCRVSHRSVPSPVLPAPRRQTVCGAFHHYPLPSRAVRCTYTDAQPRWSTAEANSARRYPRFGVSARGGAGWGQRRLELWCKPGMPVLSYLLDSRRGSDNP